MVNLLADAVSGAVLVHPNLDLCFHAVQEVVQFWVGYVYGESFSKEDGTDRKLVGHIL